MSKFTIERRQTGEPPRRGSGEVYVVATFDVNRRGNVWNIEIVDAYPADNPDRLGTLVVLGNLLLDCGDLGAARDAYEVVLGAKLTDDDIVATATNGLAQVAAQRNDIVSYERAIQKLEAVRARIQVEVWTEILLDRAKDELILGRVDRAHGAVEQATALAKKHKFGWLVIEADKTRATLDNPEPTPQRSVVKGTNRVRGKLRELREAL